MEEGRKDKPTMDEKGGLFTPTGVKTCGKWERRTHGWDALGRCRAGRPTSRAQLPASG